MSGKIYCGRLPPTCTEKNLEDLVKSFGKVREVDFREGFAYVVFKDGKDADKAVQALNNTNFLGQSILVERAKEARNGVGGYTVAGGFTARVKQMGPPTRSEYRVRVENLSTRAKWLELKEFMNTAGEVCFADTHRRRPGEGVVEFTTEEDMRRAIQGLDKKEFFGRKIRIIEETPKAKKSLSRSRSKSPVRSDSRRRRSSSRRCSHSPRRERSESRSRRKKERSRSRKRSESKEKRKSRSKSRSRSHSRSKKNPSRRSRSRSHSRSYHKKHSRSSRKERSPSESRSKRRSKHNDERSRSRSKTRSKKKHSSRSRSRSKSHKSKRKHKRSRSRSQKRKKARRKSRSHSKSRDKRQSRSHSNSPKKTHEKSRDSSVSDSSRSPSPVKNSASNGKICPKTDSPQAEDNDENQKSPYSDSSSNESMTPPHKIKKHSKRHSRSRSREKLSYKKRRKSYSD